MKNILQYLELSLELYPDHLAFADKDNEYTYKELVNISRRIGSYFLNKGIRNKAIFIYMRKSANEIGAFLGTVYAGCFYVPIDDRMPAERINKIINTVGAGIVIYDDTTEKNIGKLNQTCEFVNFSEAVQSEIDKFALGVVRNVAIDTDPVYILFTSGSTGIPKGVVICHKSVISYSEWLKSTFKFDENTVFGNQTPFYFSMSVLDIYATISSGASLWIIPKTLFSFPVKLLEFLDSKKINTIYWVPSVFSLVTQFDTFSYVIPHYLKTILFAGEVMPTKQLNLWKEKIPNATYANLFGPTEITDIGIYYIINREFSDDEPIPIGGTCDNVDAFVIGDNGEKITEPELKGELYIRGSFLSPGYFHNSAKTEEVFVQNPLNHEYPEIVYKTGDIVYYNNRGEMMYSSRKDFQIKHMGNRIELGEIENSLSAVQGVDSCCCLYEPEKDMILGIYAGKTDIKEIVKALSERLPSYMIPNEFYKLDTLPLNSNGKIDRNNLKVRFVKGK